MEVFATPEEIKNPVTNLKDIKAWKEDEERYINEVREFCKSESDCDSDYVGKIAKFQVADGYAEYMVFSIKPLELLHLDVGDAWDYQHIERLKVKDIKENIDRQEKLAKLFS